MLMYGDLAVPMPYTKGIYPKVGLSFSRPHEPE